MTSKNACNFLALNITENDKLNISASTIHTIYTLFELDDSPPKRQVALEESPVDPWMTWLRVEAAACVLP